MDGMFRKYECEYYSVMARPTSCFFCDHCTDIWFDYTNGPYMFYCDIDKNTAEGIAGKCKSFIEE